MSSQTPADIAADLMKISQQPEPQPAKSLRAAAAQLATKIRKVYQLEAVTPCYNQAQADQVDGRHRRNCVLFAMQYPGQFLKPINVNFSKLAIRDTRNHFYLMQQAGELLQQTIGLEMINIAETLTGQEVTQ